MSDIQEIDYTFTRLPARSRTQDNCPVMSLQDAGLIGMLSVASGIAEGVDRPMRNLALDQSDRPIRMGGPLSVAMLERLSQLFKQGFHLPPVNYNRRPTDWDAVINGGLRLIQDMQSLPIEKQADSLFEAVGRSLLVALIRDEMAAVERMMLEVQPERIETTGLVVILNVTQPHAAKSQVVMRVCDAIESTLTQRGA